jgi:hypothetical protein
MVPAMKVMRPGGTRFCSLFAIQNTAPAFRFLACADREGGSRKVRGEGSQCNQQPGPRFGSLEDRAFNFDLRRTRQQTAAISVVFNLVNSAAALAGTMGNLAVVACPTAHLAGLCGIRGLLGS